MRTVKNFLFSACFTAIVISSPSLFADAVVGAGNNVLTAPSTETATGITSASSTSDSEGYQAKKCIIGLYFFDSARGADVLDFSKSNAVQPDYIIKNGDEIAIDIWGDLDLHYSLPVNKDGFVTIPSAGRVDLNGLTFTEAKKKIIHKFADIYNFYIDVNNPGAGKAHIDIAMGKIAGIQIYVTGEVKTQGSISLNGTNSSAIMAIRAAGGISDAGTIRNIRIIHPDGKETAFDVYDFMFYGKLLPDIKYLKDGDIINVPFRKSQATITGAVVRPGNYEIFENDMLRTLISLAGGLQKYASSNVKIYRERRGVFLVDKIGKKEIFNIDFNNLEQDVKLQSGDVIAVELFPESKIYDIIKVQGNAVRIPGEFEYSNGLKISDYIEKAGGMYQDAEDKVDILRYSDNLQTVIIALSLKEILKNNPKQNIEVKPGDVINLYNTKDIYGTQYISLEGHVKKPGNYLYRKGLTALEILIKEGGLLDRKYLSNVYLKQANIFRMDLSSQKKEVIAFQIGKLLDGDMKENVELKPGDKIIVYDLAAMQEIKSITIEGEINKPGNYRIDENANLNSVIIEAGGFKADALIEKIEIGMKGADFSKTCMIIDYNTPAGKNYALKNNDFIIIRNDPYYEIRSATVEVGGEIRIPGKYNYIKDEKITTLIERAGGLRNDAFLEGTEFYRNGQRAQINLKKSMKNKDTHDNFTVLPGDRLVIPEKKYFIEVKGAVIAPKRYLYKEGEAASYYIDMAGGITNNADRGNTKIIKPDGIVKDAFNTFWPNPEVEMGSVIEVPAKR